jgi:plastocyanin
MGNVEYFAVEWPWRIMFSVAALLAVFSSNAAEIEVTVLDRDGNPVPDIAVYVQLDQDGPLPAPAHGAVMAQADTRFVPHLLVVQTGTQVEFSNSDVVAHHVYSFSKPNNFTLPLYKGDLQTQILFDHGGVVTLGCNIHDHMLAYILVVDSHIFGKTDFDGKMRLSTDNPNGLTVSIWSPRIYLTGENLTQTVKSGRSAQITFSLTEKLRVSHDDKPEELSWNVQ